MRYVLSIIIAISMIAPSVSAREADQISVVGSSTVFPLLQS